MPPFTPNNVWSTNPSSGTSEELTLPSGQTCLAHRLGMEGLVEAGILDNVDELTSLVDSKYIQKARGTKAESQLDMKGILSNPGGLKAIITLADKALPHIVDSPVVVLHYVTSGNSTRALTDTERQDILRDKPDAAFTDQIGLEDKMFLFDWAIGNLASMRKFRNDTRSDVAGVADVPGVSRPAKRAARRK